MSHLALLMMLRRYRLVYLAIFILTFIAAAYVLIPIVVKYEGSSTFYHINENLVNPTNFSQKGAKIIHLNDPLQERLYQLTYSTEVLDFLIKEFNLYNHYKIDSTRDYHYEKIIGRLSSKIIFKRNTTDLFTISVYDKDSELAAKMANAIVSKLDELNKNYLINKMQTNLNFYESFLKESEKLSEEQNVMILSFIDKLKSFSEKTSDKKATTKTELEYSLYQAASGIEEVTTQLMIAKGLYSNAILTQQSNELPSLMIIKKAYPNPKSKTIHVILLAALAGTLMCIVIFLIMYFFHAYAKDIQIVFGKETPAS